MRLWNKTRIRGLPVCQFAYPIMCIALLTLGPLLPPMGLGDTLFCLDWRVFPAVEHIPYRPTMVTRGPPPSGARLPQEVVFIPSWLPAGVLALVGLVVPRLLVEWHDVGQCQRCRYDLRGNVSGRCPECGTPIPAKYRRSSV